MTQQITLQQEKAAIQLLPESNFTSLSQIFDDDTIDTQDKVISIAFLLHEISPFTSLMSKTSFSEIKSYFKANTTNLVGSISGISLSTAQFKSIINSDEIPNIIKCFIFGVSLPFDFMNDVENQSEIFNYLMSQDYSGFPAYPKFLATSSMFTNSNLLTEDHYYKILRMSYIDPENICIKFAACPHTRDWVKKEHYSYYSDGFDNPDKIESYNYLFG